MGKLNIGKDKTFQKKNPTHSAKQETFIQQTPIIFKKRTKTF